MSIKSYYLDSSKEIATEFILNELGLDFSNNTSDLTEINNDSVDIKQEHKFNSIIKLKLVKGSGYLDIRDFSDSWIRVHLNEGDQIAIPANLYRKFIEETESIINLSSSVDKPNFTLRFAESKDAVEVIKYHNYRELVCELCRQFFEAGWVTGTGGSISIRYGNRIYMTPSGVQKERIKPDELFVLDTNGSILAIPSQKPGCNLPKLSDCAPLFLHAYKQRNAGAVLHSHAYSTNLITSLFEGKSEFRVSHQEMIKGITGHGYYDELVIPIIENTAWEHELADSLGETIAKYPKSVAVLVRRHGMYVWGRTWEEAKRHGECLHYLFEVVIEMKKLGLDFTRGPILASKTEVNGSTKRSSDSTSESLNKKLKSSHTHVVFDIEGTVTPIDFVKTELFGYASNNVKDYLLKHWTTSQTIDDVKALLQQAEVDSKDSTLQFPFKIPTSVDKQSSIDFLVDYVKWNITNDRKVSALKQLQGHIWYEGYSSGELKSVVYDDVPSYFERLHQSNVNISIYSSGSREAQKLLFKYSNHGDLRQYLSCFFDTVIGNKKDKSSYLEIIKYLGVDSPKDVLFITDVYEEAEAAANVGIDVILSIRDGTAPLPTNNAFKTVTNFNSL
eukprot:gene17799-23407_t